MKLLSLIYKSISISLINTYNTLTPLVIKSKLLRFKLFRYINMKSVYYQDIRLIVNTKNSLYYDEFLQLKKYDFSIFTSDEKLKLIKYGSYDLHEKLINNTYDYLLINEIIEVTNDINRKLILNKFNYIYLTLKVISYCGYELLIDIYNNINLHQIDKDIIISIFEKMNYEDFEIYISDYINNKFIINNFIKITKDYKKLILIKSISSDYNSLINHLISYYEFDINTYVFDV